MNCISVSIYISTYLRIYPCTLWRTPQSPRHWRCIAGRTCLTSLGTDAPCSVLLPLHRGRWPASMPRSSVLVRRDAGGNGRAVAQSAHSAADDPAKLHFSFCIYTAFLAKKKKKKIHTPQSSLQLEFNSPVCSGPRALSVTSPSLQLTYVYLFACVLYMNAYKCKL